MAVQLAVVVALPSPLAYAQVALVSSPFSSPPSPVGAGARATGMGSAFIAVADDATAASWNPGGLTQLERPEVSIVGRTAHEVDRYGTGSETSIINDLVQTRTVSGDEDSFTSTTLDYLSAAVPFSIADRNAVASINYQQMYSFDRDFHYQGTTASPDGQGQSQGSFVQNGGLDAITAALCGEAMPDLSIGAALNYWLDGLSHPYAWRQNDHTTTVITTHGHSFSSEALSQVTHEHFGAFNATFGLLWKIDPTLSFGAVGKLPVSSRVFRTIEDLNDPTSTPGHDHFRMYFPFSVGAGLAWRPNDQFTLSTDLTYVDWGSFRVTDSQGQKFLISGDPADQYSVDGILTPRVGAEYVWLLSDLQLAGRLGLFYDPEPARESPTPVWGGSIGLGATFPHTSIDAAYQMRVANDVTGTFTATQLFQIATVPADKVQHLFYLSLVQYF